MPSISLSDAAGRGQRIGNRVPDTLKLKLGLERLGYYAAGPKGFFPGADDELWYGLERYQRDRGLEVDGLALPDGPTVTSLNADLQSAPPTALISGNLDTTLSAEAVASNRRMVHALRSTGDVGDLPAFAVSALKSGNDSAPSEIADLLAQARATAPDRAADLRDAMAEYLDGDDLARIDDAVSSKIAQDSRSGVSSSGSDSRKATQLAQADKSKAGQRIRIVPNPPAEQRADIAETLASDDVAPEWLNKVFERETMGEPNGGWGTTTYDKNGVPAYGRFQLTPEILQDAGIIDSDDRWTGKYGLNSASALLNNPDAQRAAMKDTRKVLDRYAKDLNRIGQKIEGAKANITVTEGALAAALHRQGHGTVKRYFEWLDSVGGKSGANFANLPEPVRSKFQSVETRLREFEHLPYKRRR